MSVGIGVCLLTFIALVVAFFVAAIPIREPKIEQAFREAARPDFQPPYNLISMDGYTISYGRDSGVDQTIFEMMKEGIIDRPAACELPRYEPYRQPVVIKREPRLVVRGYEEYRPEECDHDAIEVQNLAGDVVLSERSCNCDIVTTPEENP